ncbi:aryl-sulfate sulfotransferase [candidate division KSB1 bacterium]
MAKRIIVFCCAILFICTIGTKISYSQDITIGLLQLNQSKAFNGYTLFAPNRSTDTFLIDNFGGVVHVWHSEHEPINVVNLLENGNLIKLCEPDDEEFNGRGLIQEYDWDGNIVWEYDNTRPYAWMHHDIERLPNGNTLAVINDRIEYQDCIDAGRRPELIFEDYIISESIIEINPQKEIVWEWRFRDHLSSASGGTVNGKSVSTDTTDPGKMNFNYTPRLNTDWIHINAVDYNPELDQIAISSHFMSEFYIIDHSTADYINPSAGIEAAAGPAGDILYRWGNPVSYSIGTEADKILYGAHDIQWILPNNPGAGNLLVFNNGTQRPKRFSRVDEIIPPLNINKTYDRQPASIFGPAEPVWKYTAPVKTDFFSRRISGAQRLPNGNTLICEGDPGRFFEVTNEGEMVWEYINPVTRNGPQPQGTVITLGNGVFRCYRFAPDFPAFEGKAITASEPLEGFNIVTSVNDNNILPLTFTLHQNYPNPFNPVTNIKFDLDKTENATLLIYNSLGEEVKTIVSQLLTPGTHVYTWDGSNNSGSKVSSGIYFYRLTAGNQAGLKRMIYIK